MSIIILRIFLRPVFFWLLAILAYWYMAGYIVDLFSDSQILIGLAKQIESAAMWIALVPFAIGAFLMLERLQILHDWSTEPAEGCNFCGGPQEDRSGRFGPYKKCFVCQQNEKIR